MPPKCKISIVLSNCSLLLIVWLSLFIFFAFLVSVLFFISLSKVFAFPTMTIAIVVALFRQVIRAIIYLGAIEKSRILILQHGEKIISHFWGINNIFTDCILKLKHIAIQNINKQYTELYI